jgi:hypothetical protein
MQIEITRTRPHTAHNPAYEADIDRYNRERAAYETALAALDRGEAPPPEPRAISETPTMEMQAVMFREVHPRWPQVSQDYNRQLNEWKDAVARWELEPPDKRSVIPPHPPDDPEIDQYLTAEIIAYVPLDATEKDIDTAMRKAYADSSPPVVVAGQTRPL